MSQIPSQPLAQSSAQFPAISPAGQKPLERLQRLLPDLFEPQILTGDLFLRCQLGSDIQAVLTLDAVVETLQVPASHLTPIPQMPGSTLGLMSYKGNVLWGVDLVQLLGVDGPQRRSRRHEIAIVRVKTLAGSSSLRPSNPDDELLLGLAVSHIRGTLRLQPDAIAPIDEELPPQFVSCLQGQVRQADETLWVLNVEDIAHHPTLRSPVLRPPMLQS